MQLISTPDLCIIDYGVGLPGSQHDATAWAETRIPNEHATLLEEQEWVWGDSAYPLKTITTHLIIMSPEYLEHCVGFLKGHWQSLCGLQVCINQSNHLQYASLWITTCVLLHAFAMEHEGGIDFSTDQFYRKGQELMRRERVERERGVMEQDVYSAEEGEAAHDIELIEGRLKREELKKALFSHLYGEN